MVDNLLPTSQYLHLVQATTNVLEQGTSYARCLDGLDEALSATDISVKWEQLLKFSITDIGFVLQSHSVWGRKVGALLLARKAIPVGSIAGPCYSLELV